MTRRASRPAVAFITVLGVLASWTTASACINDVFYDLDEEIRSLRRAEDLLARGQARRAMVLAHRVWQVTAEGEASGDPESERAVGSERDRRRAAELESRAVIVRAVAIVRLDGQVTRQGRAARSVNAAVREENLAWAVNVLESAASGVDDPVLRARLGEAVALVPARRQEAREVLRELAEQDLMPDAFGYAALAQLETDDPARAAAAMELCRTRAGEHARSICRQPQS